MKNHSKWSGFREKKIKNLDFCCAFKKQSVSLQEDMKKVGDMKLYSFEELLEEDYGKVGTPERDAFERNVDEAVQAYRVGEAIKQARESQNLTQAELGEKMGVQRAQVCRLESGKSITLASMMRAFRALGVQVALEMKGIGKVAL